VPAAPLVDTSPGQTPTLSMLLGCTDPGAAAAVARSLLQDAVGLDPVMTTLVSVDYQYGSPATGGLFRLLGTDAAGVTASLFCKVLQHVRHWPTLGLLPPEARAMFVAQFPWRSELELWDPIVQRSLPEGLRSPRLHRVIDLGDDRLAVWQEDVTQIDGEWQLRDFAQAAQLLGRWNARCAQPDLLATSPLPPGYALRMYAQQAVVTRGLGPLADDDLWSHPWLRDHADLRGGLVARSEHIPAMLDRLDHLPQSLPHGDASPQNLLRAPDGGLVAIDLSFRSPHALGFDLGQLLVGLVHAGELPAARLPEVAAVIAPAYLDGVRAAGTDVDDDDVLAAFATSVLLRSGFDGLRYDLLDGPPSARHAFDERLALSRFLLAQETELGLR
jgi:hypothetical protein